MAGGCLCLEGDSDPPGSFVTKVLDVLFCLATEFWGKTFAIGPDGLKPSVLVQDL